MWLRDGPETVRKWVRHADDVTRFFRSESYESHFAASVSWKGDCEHNALEKGTAFTGASREKNPTG